MLPQPAEEMLLQRGWLVLNLTGEILPQPAGEVPLLLVGEVMPHLVEEVLLQRGRLQWVRLLLLPAWPVLLQVAGWVPLLPAEEVLMQPGG